MALPPPRGPRPQPSRLGHTVAAWDFTGAALMLAGTAITCLVYKSLLPVFVILIFLGGSNLLLFAPVIGGGLERKIFNRAFAVCLLTGAIAAVYAEILQDEGQLRSDASTFFERSSDLPAGMTIDVLRYYGEGSLAVVIWSKFYNFFGALGFPKDRYIGILVNTILVAFTAVVTQKMARLAFGEDASRFKRLMLLFSTCGLLWVFGSIHLRDSFILLANALLMLAWVYFLVKPEALWRIVPIVALSLLLLGILPYFRTDFVFVPIAIAVAGVGAIIFSRNTRQTGVVYIIAIIGLLVAAVLIAKYQSSAQEAIAFHNQGYNELREREDPNISLGVGLGQRLSSSGFLPVRVLWHSVHLFLFPVPFWTGFQLYSAYFLYKSFNVLFFYALLPLLGVVIYDLFRYRAARSPAVVFSFLVALGMTIAIAASSTETRHLGAFLPAFFVMGLAPDFRIDATWQRYKRLLYRLLLGMTLVHAAWVWLAI